MQPEGIRVLLVQDDPDDEAAVRRALGGNAQPAALTVAATLAEAETLAAAGGYDVILADLHLPDAEGIAVIDRLSAAAPRLALVALTGWNDEELSIAALRQGAQDHLVKGGFDAAGLWRALRHAVERKRLLDENRRLSAFPGNCSQPVMAMEPSGRVAYANPAASRLLAQTGAEDVEAVLPPRHREWMAACHQGWTGRDVASFAGRVFVWTYNSAPDLGLVYLYGNEVTDRTRALEEEVAQRRRAEEVLRRSEEKYRALLDNAADAILVVDEEGRIAEANRKAGEMLGQPADALRGVLVHILYSESDRRRLMKALRSIEPGDSAQVEDVILQRRPGEVLHVDIAVSVVCIGDERIYLGIFKDITAHKRVEDQLRAAKEAAELADRAKSEFLANMSHELRTPLNAIIGFSDIMRNQLLGPLGLPEYKGYAEDIHASGSHLLELINDVLDMSKVESGRVELRPECVDLSQVARACVRLVSERAAAGRVEIEVALPADLPCVNVDKRRMKQIMLNLLSNAVKFTPAGGRVTVSACNADDGLSLWVADTGIGMDADGLVKAMQPFGQVDSRLARRYQGTGLGLPLTKAFTELHGGRFTIDSTPGIGTRATVWLPPGRVLPQCAGGKAEMREPQGDTC